MNTETTKAARNNVRHRADVALHANNANVAIDPRLMLAFIDDADALARVTAGLEKLRPYGMVPESLGGSVTGTTLRILDENSLSKQDDMDRRFGRWAKWLDVQALFAPAAEEPDAPVWEGDLNDDCTARWMGLVLRASDINLSDCEEKWAWGVAVRGGGGGRVGRGFKPTGPEARAAAEVAARKFLNKETEGDTP